MHGSLAMAWDGDGWSAPADGDGWSAPADGDAPDDFFIAVGECLDPRPAWVAPVRALHHGQFTRVRTVGGGTGSGFMVTAGGPGWLDHFVADETAELSPARADRVLRSLCQAVERLRRQGELEDAGADAFFSWRLPMQPVQRRPVIAAAACPARPVARAGLAAVCAALLACVLLYAIPEHVVVDRLASPVSSASVRLSGSSAANIPASLAASGGVDLAHRSSWAGGSEAHTPLRPDGVGEPTPAAALAQLQDSEGVSDAPRAAAGSLAGYSAELGTAASALSAAVASGPAAASRPGSGRHREAVAQKGRIHEAMVQHPPPAAHAQSARRIVRPRPARELQFVSLCPSCSCRDLFYKRSFTPEPLRREEQAFLQARCDR